MDTISNFLTKIRNAMRVHKKYVYVPQNKMNRDILTILKNEGFIVDFIKKENYTEKDEPVKLKKEIWVDERDYRIELKYDGIGRSALHGLERLSKPSRRLYIGSSDIPRVFNGYGIVVVSTSKGVITGKEARALKTGGELICSVW